MQGFPKRMSAEQKILEIWRNELVEARKDERRQALADVSGILTWLTMNPLLSREKLIEYVLAEFEKATPYDCRDIKTKIDFYRKTLRQQ
jgi:hypothetical protein